MNSLTDLREVVDVVIGVDTHVHTHSAAALDTATGGVLEEITVDATAQGHAELVEFANKYATLRAWAIEGTGGHVGAHFAQRHARKSFVDRVSSGHVLVGPMDRSGRSIVGGNQPPDFPDHRW
mgnify:CR=1 FL=1